MGQTESTATSTARNIVDMVSTAHNDALLDASDVTTQSNLLTFKGCTVNGGQYTQTNLRKITRTALQDIENDSAIDSNVVRDLKTHAEAETKNVTFKSSDSATTTSYTEALTDLALNTYNDSKALCTTELTQKNELDCDDSTFNDVVFTQENAEQAMLSCTQKVANDSNLVSKIDDIQRAHGVVRETDFIAGLIDSIGSIITDNNPLRLLAGMTTAVAVVVVVAFILKLSMSSTSSKSPPAASNEQQYYQNDNRASSYQSAARRRPRQILW